MPSHNVYHLAEILGPLLMVWVFSLFTTDVSTRCVSPELYFRVFGVCMESVGRDGPLLQTVLYPPE